ncbi:MAG: twitching motility protein PilT [Flavipsychrobacter sp.]|nr:twitching motility protein PilT [Flavipsychrobacter sp.]
MKLFLDANVLVSVLTKEYPSFLYTSRILSLADNKRYHLVTTSVCLAIAFYFAEKQHGHTLAKSKVHLLLEHIDIADCGKKEAMLAIENKKIHDFEDGLQYYAAINAKCKCIITSDIDDFYFSDIEILDPERFFRKYMTAGKG